MLGGDVLCQVWSRTITSRGGNVDHCSLALGHHCGEKLCVRGIAIAIFKRSKPTTYLVAEVGGGSDIDGDHILQRRN